MGSFDTLTLVQRGGKSFVELAETKVVLRSRGAKEQVALLSIAPLVLGTDPDCDLVAVDGSISRRHCELRWTEGGIRLRDFGSKNGTRLAGARLSEAVVPVGSRLAVGNSLLLLKLGRGVQHVPLSDHVQFGDAVGRSVPMRALFARLEQLAPLDDSLLLLGESGTGKEVLARAVHELSARKDGPLVVFDCGAVTASLVEAELFGSVKGAFTGAVRDTVGLFEQAHGGTLFIDEIGDLPLELQPRLLRALEDHRVRPVGADHWRDVDVRIIAATHRDLRSRMSESLFRPDLYYRLAGAEVMVPPLRERGDDVELLARQFLSRLTPPVRPEELAPSILAMLRAYEWPGNVRELRNVCARLGVFSDSEAALPAGMVSLRASSPPMGRTHLSWKDARDGALAQFEREYLREVLALHRGNVSETARAMGTSRQLTHRLLARYGLGTREE